MNDSELNDASSWQPDPTGRYKLRWRDGSGDWTHHVYSDDGERDNDPYPPPSGLPIQPDIRDVPTGGEKTKETADLDMKRGRKGCALVFACALALSIVVAVVLVIIGGAGGDRGDDGGDEMCARYAEAQRAEAREDRILMRLHARYGEDNVSAWTSAEAREWEDAVVARGTAYLAVGDVVPDWVSRESEPFYSYSWADVDAVCNRRSR